MASFTLVPTIIPGGTQPTYGGPTTVVGGDTALQTDDGDSSYVDLIPPTSNPAHDPSLVPSVAFVFNPVFLPAGSILTLPPQFTFSVRNPNAGDIGSHWGGEFRLFTTSTPSGAGYGSFAQFGGLPNSFGWHGPVTFSDPDVFHGWLPTLADLAAGVCGTLTNQQDAQFSGTDMSWVRLGYVSMTVMYTPPTTTPPLRQRQRASGLAGTAGPPLRQIGGWHAAGDHPPLRQRQNP
jgi:hypothetical protein